MTSVDDADTRARAAAAVAALHMPPRILPLRFWRLLLLFVPLMTSGVCANGIQQTQSTESMLVFGDEFNELDMNRWEHEITANGGGNWEFQYYTNNRSNSYAENGVLHIKPTLTADLIGIDKMMSYDLNLWGSTPADLCTSNAFWGCQRIGGGGGNIVSPVQSARIRTANSFSFKYGRLEVRAKLPRGDWLWPAIWLLPRHNQYGKWPASGEIDVVEARGNNWAKGGVNTVSSTLHFGPHYPLNAWSKHHAESALSGGKDFSQDFHVFGLVWLPDRIYTYVDEDDTEHRLLDSHFTESQFHVNGWDSLNIDNPWRDRPCCNAPFDQEYFVTINLAVGGTGGFFQDGVGNKPWSDADRHSVNAFWNARAQWLPTWSNASLQVDWIRVWQNASGDLSSSEQRLAHLHAATAGISSVPALVHTYANHLHSPRPTSMSMLHVHFVCACYAAAVLLLVASAHVYCSLARSRQQHAAVNIVQSRCG